MTAHGTFCTVFDCMDGRCQQAVSEWCRKNFGAEYPDTITIAGCDGVLVGDSAERERALSMARISAEKHGAKTAVVVGHSHCAGYDVSNEDHKDAVCKAAAIVHEAGIFEHVVGLFDDVDTGKIEEVCRT